MELSQVADVTLKLVPSEVGRAPCRTSDERSGVLGIIETDRDGLTERKEREREIHLVSHDTIDEA